MSSLPLLQAVSVRGLASTRLTAYLVLSSLAVAWTWLAGRDVNWDLFNYHVYAGFLALNPHRLWQDYFPASLQSYLNPYAYVPFWLLVKAGLPGLTVGIAMALLHSAALWVTYEIARACLARKGEASPAWVAASVALGALSPLYLQQVGTSFADVTTGIPVLVGFLLIVLSSKQALRRAKSMVLLAGVTMGLAAGLKLTNAVLAAGAAAFVLSIRTSWQDRLGRAMLYGAGGIAGAVAASGYWSWLLWSRFGNPVFPLWNAVFGSPDYPLHNFRHERFVADSPVDLLLLPFRMAVPMTASYVEEQAPDVRFAALMIIAVAVVLLARRMRAGPPRDGGDAFGALAFGFFGAFLLWALYSANGRYMLPLTLLVGPVLVGLTLRIAGPQRLRVYVVSAVLLAQVTTLAIAATPRWQQAPWNGRWIELEVPERLRTEAFVYASVTPQSASFVAPYVEPTSRFVNIVGQFALPRETLARVATAPGTAGGRMPIRTLGLVDSYDPDLEPSEDEFALHKAVISPFGLAIDRRDCAVIKLATGLGGLVTRKEPGRLTVTLTPHTTSYLSCATVVAPFHDAARIRLERADVALDALEAACPRLMQPRGAVTIVQPKSYLRFYAATDTVVTYKEGRLFLGPDWNHRTAVEVTVEDLAQNVPKCGAR